MSRHHQWMAVLCLAFGATVFSAHGETVKIAALGDFGAGAESYKVDKLIAGWSPDLVITVGDNAYSKDVDGNGHPRNAFEVDVVRPFGAFINAGKFFPALGNHDYRAEGGGIVPERVQRYLDTLKPPLDGPGAGRFYEHAKGPVRIFAVNSNGRHEPQGGIRFWDKQGDWLRDRLAAATEPFKIVYFHHTPYTTGTEDGPTASMRWPFKEWGASLVLAGHEHNYERFDRRGFPYAVNGIGGAHFYGLAKNKSVPGLTRLAAYPTTDTAEAEWKHGAMLIEVSDTELKATEFIVKSGTDPVEGKAIDSFTITAGAALPPPVYRDLQMGVKGRDVSAWQDFLFEHQLLGSDLAAVDGDFGGATRTATTTFQQQNGIATNGKFDAATREKARSLGFKPVEDPNPN